MYNYIHDIVQTVHMVHVTILNIMRQDCCRNVVDVSSVVTDHADTNMFISHPKLDCMATCGAGNVHFCGTSDSTSSLGSVILNLYQLLPIWSVLGLRFLITGYVIVLGMKRTA